MDGVYINQVKVVQAQEMPLSISGQMEKFGDRLIGKDRAVFGGKTYQICPQAKNHEVIEDLINPFDLKKPSLRQKINLNLGVFFKQTAAKLSPEIAAKYALIKENDPEKQRNIYKMLLPKAAEGAKPIKEGNNDAEHCLACAFACCQFCSMICCGPHMR